MKVQFYYLKTTTSLLLSLLTLSISVSCSNDDDDQVLFLWNQTGCADPWDNGSATSNEEISAAMKSYLSENGVKDARIINFEFDESLATSCLACSCTTGTIIHVETAEANSSKMETLGFYRGL